MHLEKKIDLWKDLDIRSIIIALGALLLAKYISGFALSIDIPYKFFDTEFALGEILKKPKVIILAIILAISYFFIRKIKIRKPERIFQHPFWFINVLLLVILFVQFGLGPYNYFTDSLYLYDRILLFILLVIGIVRPELTILFVIQAFLISKQFQLIPFLYYSFTDKLICFEILTLISIYYFISLFVKINVKIYAYAILSPLIIWFVYAFIGKIEIHWWNNSVSNLMASSNLMNWWLVKTSFGKFFYNIIEKNNIYVIIGTLTVEFLPILFFLNRRLSFFILLGMIFFHLMVFVSSGIFFWKWILLETLILLLVYYKKIEIEYSFRSFLISLLFIISIPLIMGQTKLSWLDGHLANFHVFEIEDANNHIVRLDPAFFAPYDLIFAQNRFKFFENTTIVADTYGALNNYDAFNTLEEEKYWDSNKFEKFKNEYGINHYNEEKKEIFKDWLKRFISNKFERGALDNIPITPMHIYQNPDVIQPLKNFDPIKLHIHYYEVYHRGLSSCDTLYSNSESILLY